MFNKRKLIPDNFDDLVVERSITGMPGEHAFAFQLNLVRDGEPLQWQRVWVIHDLDTVLAEIDVGLDPLDTLERTRKHKLHQFRVAVLRYLKISKQQLVLDGDSLKLEQQA